MPRSDRNLKLERRWRKWLARWERSQQSIRGFCGDHQLSEASFYVWRREIARRDREHADLSVPATSASPTFVPVRVIPDTPIEIVLSSGVVVRVPVGGDPVAVARLVAALEATR